MKPEEKQVRRLENEPGTGGRRSARLRQRAAWMYHVEEMTQSAIAEALGVGRVTVVRLLSEARAMNEVRISLSRDISELSRLEIDLQKAFDIPEVVVAPLSVGGDPRLVIGAASGRFITDLLQPGMKIGLGWGRTLFNALGFLDELSVSQLTVVSLLGGITHVRQVNPAEFAWQFSRLFLADCYLLAAPAIVDSAETKKALIERCGLREVFDFAKSLDVVVVSTGGMASSSTTKLFGFISDSELESLRHRGAVGDMLFNFFDQQGRLVEHPVNERVMSIPINTIAATPNRILVAGGDDKIDAMIGAFALVRPTVVITDEFSARALLDRASNARQDDPAQPDEITARTAVLSKMPP